MGNLNISFSFSPFWEHQEFCQLGAGCPGKGRTCWCRWAKNNSVRHHFLRSNTECNPSEQALGERELPGGFSCGGENLCTSLLAGSVGRVGLSCLTQRWAPGHLGGLWKLSGVALGQGHVSWPGLYSGGREVGRKGRGGPVLSDVWRRLACTFQGRPKTKCSTNNERQVPWSAPRSRQTQKCGSTLHTFFPPGSVHLLLLGGGLVNGCVSLRETGITGGFCKICTGKGPAAEAGPFLLLGEGEVKGAAKGEPVPPARCCSPWGSWGSQWVALNGSLVAASESRSAPVCAAGQAKHLFVFWAAAYFQFYFISILIPKFRCL